jgi:uncharacterized protein with von Willebrand factor type A (vWA) domain
MARRKYYHSCLNTDSYDKQSFQRLVDVSSKLQAIEEKGDKAFSGFINLMGDQWSSLYKTTPQLLPETDVSETARLHKPMIKKLMASEEYGKLRDTTVLDDFSSALGTIVTSEKIIEYIENRKKIDEELKEKLKQQQKLQQQLEKLQNSMQNNKKGPTKKQKEKEKALQNELNNLSQQVSQSLADGLPVQQILSQAAQETKETKDSMEELLSGSQPGSGHMEMQKIPLRNQLELAMQLKQYPKIKKVAEWAGRFKRIARKKQKSKNVFSVERQGISLGSDPELLLPTELAQLKNPATRLDFYRRFAEKQTLQYTPLGKEQAGKGPIVLCLDQSGSMNRLKEQAAGFALAIAMIARAQRRDFAYITFDSSIGEVFTFPKGKISTEAIVEMATSFLGGGTNFEKPLSEAIKIIQKTARFKNADIIFVTDGEAEIGEDFLRNYKLQKERLKFQCMGCILGNGSSYINNHLAKVTDELFYAQDLIEAAENSSIFKI